MNQHDIHAVQAQQAEQEAGELRQEAEQMRSRSEARVSSRQLLAGLREAEDAAERAVQVRLNSELEDMSHRGSVKSGLMSGTPCPQAELAAEGIAKASMKSRHASLTIFSMTGRHPQSGHFPTTGQRAQQARTAALAVHRAGVVTAPVQA